MGGESEWERDAKLSSNVSFKSYDEGSYLKSRNSLMKESKREKCEAEAVSVKEKARNSVEFELPRRACEIDSKGDHESNKKHKELEYEELRRIALEEAKKEYEQDLLLYKSSHNIGRAHPQAVPSSSFPSVSTSSPVIPQAVSSSHPCVPPLSPLNSPPPPPSHIASSEVIVTSPIDSPTLLQQQASQAVPKTFYSAPTPKSPRLIVNDSSTMCHPSSPLVLMRTPNATSKSTSRTKKYLSTSQLAPITATSKRKIQNLVTPLELNNLHRVSTEQDAFTITIRELPPPQPRRMASTSNLGKAGNQIDFEELHMETSSENNTPRVEEFQTQMQELPPSAGASPLVPPPSSSSSSSSVTEKTREKFKQKEENVDIKECKKDILENKEKKQENMQDETNKRKRGSTGAYESAVNKSRRKDSLEHMKLRPRGNTGDQLYRPRGEFENNKKMIPNSPTLESVAGYHSDSEFFRKPLEKQPTKTLLPPVPRTQPTSSKFTSHSSDSFSITEEDIQSLLLEVEKTIEEEKLNAQSEKHKQAGTSSTATTSRPTSKEIPNPNSLQGIISQSQREEVPGITTTTTADNKRDDRMDHKMDSHSQGEDISLIQRNNDCKLGGNENGNGNGKGEREEKGEDEKQSLNLECNEQIKASQLPDHLQGVPTENQARDGCPHTDADSKGKGGIEVEQSMMVEENHKAALHTTGQLGSDSEMGDHTHIDKGESGRGKEGREGEEKEKEKEEMKEIVYIPGSVKMPEEFYTKDLEENYFNIPRKRRNSTTLNSIKFTNRPTTKYNIMSKLGQGAYGWVYKALDKRNGDYVAIKAIPLVTEVDPDSKKLASELHILNKLSGNSNIVSYKGSCVLENEIWIVLEYCDAGSIGELVTKSNLPLSECHLAACVVPVLRALHHMHSNGIIHRDLKGENILVLSDGTIKLADFGVAFANSNAFNMMSIAGSPYWMAPELINGDRDPDWRVDIWSLGITMIQLIDKVPPYYDYLPVRVCILPSIPLFLPFFSSFPCLFSFSPSPFPPFPLSPPWEIFSFLLSLHPSVSPFPAPFPFIFLYPFPPFFPFCPFTFPWAASFVISFVHFK